MRKTNRTRRWRSACVLVCAVLMSPMDTNAQQVRELASERVPGSGVYAIWYGKYNRHLLDLPFITGGQVVVQWRTVNPAPGRFDFSAVDSELRGLHERGQRATVQINGNRTRANRWA